MGGPPGSPGAPLGVGKKSGGLKKGVPKTRGGPLGDPFKEKNPGGFTEKRGLPGEMGGGIFKPGVTTGTRGRTPGGGDPPPTTTRRGDKGTLGFWGLKLGGGG